MADTVLTVTSADDSEGRVTRRSLIVGSALAGLTVLSSPVEARAATYATPSRTEHRGLPIVWGYPFAAPARVGNGVDGYPGASYPGHIGRDYYTTPRVGTPVLAVADGRVTATGDDGERSRGVYVVIDHGSDVRSEYLHLDRGSTLVRIGQRVTRWTPLGRTGWTGDVSPKSATNAHLHLAILSGPHRTGTVWNPEWLVDDAPLPDGTLPPTEISHEEDSMAYPFHVDGRHLFMLAPGFVKHFSEYAPAVLTRDIVSADGKWIAIGGADFLRQLDSFGVPRSVVDLSQGRVLDVSTGQMAVGGMWSWARESQQNTKAILAALAKTQP